jgi:AraC-like DNA-binding protein
MSRTSFCQRFKQVSGFTPFEYQTWWRMQLAWQYLESGETVQIVADKVGYASEAAFSRSFKRQFGVAAGTVRGRMLV